MLKSFNSLLIDKVDKVECVSSGNILPEIFSAYFTCMNFYDGLVQEFFFFCIFLYYYARIYFF